ncbi:MAG: amino acid racemase [Candidatus Saccharibacteria bacterium]|nr:amino acid racemase [Candidatus Saccharibacteria bacterium]
MKRIGIIGGMSYESTIRYYTELNRLVNERAGGLNSAEIFLRSVNFENYHAWMREGDWEWIGIQLGREAKALRYGCKCDYVVIATNTMHKIADLVERYVLFPLDGLHPFVHVGDCIAEDCRRRNFNRVALLGTKFTMTEDFLVNRISRSGVTVGNIHSEILSDAGVINEIDNIIFEELCHGDASNESLRFFRNLTDTLVQKEGFDGIILGCTELGEAFHRANIPDYRLVDSAEVHIQKLAELCLS